MPKEKLSKKEFAIKDGAKIMFNSSKTKIKIKKDGSVTITLSGKIANSADLQVSSQDNTPIIFDSCGVFNSDSVENFKSGTVKDVRLFVQSSAVGIDPDIVLKSDGNDIVAKTDGEKGNHSSLNFAAAPSHNSQD